MSATEFSLFILLIAGALVEFLDLYFVLGKLRNLRNGAGRSGQRFDLVAGLIVLGFTCGFVFYPSFGAQKSRGLG